MRLFELAEGARDAPGVRFTGSPRERRTPPLEAVYLGAPAIASIRLFISSGDTSSTWVATDH